MRIEPENPEEKPASEARIAPGMQTQASGYRMVARSGVRRIRRTIRRVDPWSVLRFSFVFYLSVMLIFLLAGAIIYFAAVGAGIVDRLENFIQGIGWPEFQIRPIQVFRVFILLGISQVIFWSGVNLFVAFLYNLVSDLVGGIEVTMSEREF